MPTFTGGADDAVAMRMNTMLRIHCAFLLALGLGGCAVTAATASSPFAPADAPLPASQDFWLDAPAFAPVQVEVSVQLPPGYEPTDDHRYAVLYINDGQDMPAVRLRETLQALYRERAIRPVIVVAIHMLPDRMGTYGLSDRAHARSVVAQTKYGPVGTRAHDYSEWVARTLVPWVDARYRTKQSPDARAILGWSLGALNAFNLGWQYPEVFARVGAFSPSFWLSADNGDAEAVQRTRLAQCMVDGTPPRDHPRMFFAVGTGEEDDDRDGDGLNDAVDDTRDLIEGWRGRDGGALRGLRQQGYTINLDYTAGPSRSDVVLYTLQGGRHEQASWARMLPVFLRWAYGVQ
jgi:predicted alpha/beta superfamily hydrolase